LESLLNLGLAGEANIRILQITDTHLFAEKHETLLGVNTWESYRAVLDAIRAQQRDCDLIVATGDLSQDHTAAAYQHFADGIASFDAPCVWLPGNHDFQPAMYSTLQDAGISPSKRVFAGEHWQILLLDSQVFGVPQTGGCAGSPYAAVAPSSSAAGGLRLAGSAQSAQCAGAGQRAGALSAGEVSVMRPYPSGAGSELERSPPACHAVNLRAVQAALF